MKTDKVKFEYDWAVDAAYLTLASGQVAESNEVEPGIVVDTDSKSRVLGVEILNFSKRFSKQVAPKAVKARRKSLVAAGPGS
jgi:uncharacterized protein YuzE